jgi:Protein of unknown function (DUF2778)
MIGQSGVVLRAKRSEDAESRGRMIRSTTTADKFSSGPGAMSVAKFALVAAVLALGTAAWIADVNRTADVPESESPNDRLAASFDDRFRPDSSPDERKTDLPARSFVRSLPSELEMKFQQARNLLARNLRDLRPKEQQVALADVATPSSSAAVPLPRPRPVEATSLALNNDTSAAQSDDRTLLQKLSDLLPARVTLASLAPDGGLFHDGPDLAALGYDSFTAVYDISARAVYLPNGSKLEAHSGLGALMDDPRHVNERNVGATPPNVYDLKPREKLFHGVQALRMIPLDESGAFGRAGLLAHSYMLGPNGDSNGCVSIKAYEKFLKAFQNGEIKRLVVVTSLNDAVSASRKSASSQS